ncbi:MAG TPA: hypothetical protein VEO19_14165 [Terriglobia bacterium]|nr:hypothetical protein [Terriglobia bacterium]
MLPLFGHPIVVDIFPEASVDFEVDYDPGLPPLGIGNKLDAIYVNNLLIHL